MKTLLVTLSLLGLTAGSALAADLAPAPPPPPAPLDLFSGYMLAPVVAQLGPTTGFSTIQCRNFTKLPDGSWKALNGTLFGLGFVQKIVPPMSPIKVGGFIYNDIDLYSQLTAQCEVNVVTARY